MNAETYNTILHLINDLGFGSRTLVWISLRCTGGSQLQQVNIARGDDTTKNIINNHQQQFTEHFSCIVPITKAVRKQGGKVALELPSSNRYWRGTLVTKWIAKFDLQTSVFNGCMYGLTAPFGPQRGQLMLKSWRVATDMSPLIAELSLRCDHTVPHPAICGQNTAASENYPPDMARAVHRAFKQHCNTDNDNTSTVDRHDAGPVLVTGRKQPICLSSSRTCALFQGGPVRADLLPTAPAMSTMMQTTASSDSDSETSMITTSPPLSSPSSPSLPSCATAGTRQPRLVQASSFASPLYSCLRCPASGLAMAASTFASSLPMRPSTTVDQRLDNIDPAYRLLSSQLAR